MLTLDLNLDYVVDDEDRKNPIFKTNTAVSMTVLRSCLSAVRGGPTAGRPGGEGHKSREAVRVAARAINELTRLKNAHAKDDKATSAQFDLDVLKHFKESLEKWMTDQGIPETWSGWYEVLREYIDKMVVTGEEQAAAAAKAKAAANKTA
jgi:hypothetical protein